jgi:hypothetical protein
MDEETFESMFDSQPSTEVDPSQDATATLENGDLETSEVQEEDSVIETVVDEVQEEIDEIIDPESQELDEEVVDTEIEPEEDSAEFWKKKFESSEKQRRDLQSFNDTRFNDLSKQIAALQQQGTQQQVLPEQQEKELSKEEFQDLMVDDPQAALAYFAKKNGLVPQQQAQSNQVDIQLAIQEEAMRLTHSDFDDVMKEFQEVASLNPKLLQEVRSQPNRIKAAYDAGKKIAEAKEIQKDPVAYKEKLRKELLAELSSKDKKTRPSLRKVPGSPSIRKTSSEDMESLDTLLG